MDIAKQLLLNLSLILVLLFFFQVTVESRGNNKVSRVIVCIYFFLSVLCSMTLSVKVSDDFRFDLRQVPLIIGGLYGGNWASYFLYISTLVIRSFYGINTGFWATSLVFGLQMLFIIGFRKRFLTLAFKSKTVVSVAISIISSLLLLLTLDLMHTPLTSVKLLINYIAVPALGTGIMTYTIETWLKNRFLHKQLIKTEKMEMISHLGASIAHEIRNPLTTVSGFLQLIKMKEFDENKRVEFADMALKEIEQTESIISDFLTFAKPSIDKIEEIDVCKEIERIINIIKPLTNMNSVQLVSNFNSFGIIKADKTLFQQCLINLCNNALEAMADGGTLSISTEQAEHHAIIHITDTGVGMTEEQLQHLGEPYFSLKGNGTGLGVMVIYKIVETFKGTINVKSKMGEGTTFTLYFPLIGNRIFEDTNERVS